MIYFISPLPPERREGLGERGRMFIEERGLGGEVGYLEEGGVGGIEVYEFLTFIIIGTPSKLQV
jgi:hypothetical protein